MKYTINSILFIYTIFSITACGSSSTEMETPTNGNIAEAAPQVKEVDHYAGETFVNGSPSNPVIVNALEFIASNITHGSQDNAGDPNDLLNRIKNGERVYVTCTKASTIGQLYLEEFGIQSRVVMTLTLDTWNDNDNGHTMLEAFDTGLNKWVLFDIDNNVQPLDNNGNPVSLVDFPSLVKNDNYVLFKLADDQYFQIDDSDYDTLYAPFVLKPWYERSIQVPIIIDNDSLYFVSTDTTEEDRVESYANSLKPLNLTDFITMFYN